ncbi:MAG: tRNA epoxyqueuosine(34) reductase QueG [Pseudomonadota bacterium]
MSASGDLKAWLTAEAQAEGFDCVGVTRPDAIPQAAGRLRAFLEAGRQGSMDWLDRHAERRGDPRVLWPEVKSVIMLGVNYGPDRDPLAVLAEHSRAAISVYAQGRDYHDILKRGLKRVAGALAERAACEVKVFVDTAPLMEKPLAQAAGLGWQGKHTNLVSREFGSWLFLGAILTTAEIVPDGAERDHCGSCTRCLDVCPTRAFAAPYQLDARRCIAYLTIEHKGHIAEEFRAPIGNRVFGCDDCLAVCPWNKFAQASREARFAATGATDGLHLSELLKLDDAAFRARFAGTPVKRTGRDRLVRNALIAAGNSGDRSLVPPVVDLLDDPAPIVRAMAVWALIALDRVMAGSVADRHRAAERDGDVLAEWARLDR